MTRLRIAQIAPIAERVPPAKYGGTERVIFALSEELVRRGHDVTLFASGDSKTSANLESVFPGNLREAKIHDVYGSNEYTMLNIGYAYSMQDRFDIIHDHLAPLSLPTANFSKTPVVVTMHGAFSVNNRELFQRLNNPYVATISRAQAYTAAGINHVGTIYHGLKMNHYPFFANPDNYLLYVGRISMQKGTHIAIDVAASLGLPLVIAAKLDYEEEPYFKEFIEPRLSGDHVKWVGEVDESMRNRLMSKAICLLHPVTWKEPFGLTMIEAMACGCPVIALNKGSVSEIIIDGVTGYIAEDIEGMIDDVGAIGNIDRRRCRDYAISRFSAQRMVDEYEELYENILKARKFNTGQSIPDYFLNFGMSEKSPGQQPLSLFKDAIKKASH